MPFYNIVLKILGGVRILSRLFACAPLAPTNKSQSPVKSVEGSPHSGVWVRAHFTLTAQTHRPVGWGPQARIKSPHSCLSRPHQGYDTQHATRQQHGMQPATHVQCGRCTASEAEEVCKLKARSDIFGSKELTAYRFDYDLTKTFDVLVGKDPDQQRFTVYHDLLTQRSEFFRTARSGRWIAKPDQPTTLDDHEPEIFSVYLPCVNFGREALEEYIDAMPVPEHSSDGESGEEASDEEDKSGDNVEQADGQENDKKDSAYDGVAENTHALTAGLNNNEGSEHNDSDCGISQIEDRESRETFLVDLYLLADKLMDPITANMAIDKLKRMTEVLDLYPSTTLVKHVYCSTIRGNPLRTLLRDWYVYQVSEEWVDTLHQDEYPCAFLEDLVQETYNLHRKNANKRICNVFSPSKLVDLPKDHYHQKHEKPPSKVETPKPDEE